MAGIKIVNILKDDTFQDILELFRHTDAGEVIFVLPKNGKVFRTEDHFAAFASEAATANKTISVLCNNDRITTLAHKYQFKVMSSGKAASKKTTKPSATLASAPLASEDDDDLIPTLLDDDPELDENPNASQDEKMGRVPKSVDEDPDHIDGMHIEDEHGPVQEGDTPEDKDELKEPTDEELEAEVELVAAPAPVMSASSAAVHADLDYIDAMWRKKAREQAPLSAEETMAVTRSSSKGFSVTPKKSGLFSRMAGGFSGNTTRTSKWVASSLLATAIVVFAGVIYMTTGSANVNVTPVARALDAQITIQTSDQFATIDTDFNKLPGQLFEVTKTADSETPASGQRDVASKARGKITVYNEYSSSPQALVATTRFISSNGLVFRTLQSISVPGLTVSDGKTIPGSITVDIIADKPGTQYNIQPGKFTVAAFQEKGDTERTAKIYGESTAGFSGGASGPSKVVTQADFDAAKNAAIKAVNQQIKDAFAQQGSGMMVLDTIEPVITSVESTAQPDDAGDTVRVAVTGTIKTVAFRTTDLEKLVAQSILKKQRLAVLPSKLSLDYSDIQFKSDMGVLSFTVAVKGTGYAPLDQQKITNDIRGMSAAQIQEYFGKLDGVDSASVSFSPFWVRSVPQKADRIHYEPNYTSK